jgi:hypothetical protein
VEGEGRKIRKYGGVGAVRGNTVIRRKRKCNESELQNAVPVHPYVKGKLKEKKGDIFHDYCVNFGYPPSPRSVFLRMKVK